MNTERLDTRAVDKVKGTAWNSLRSAFESINEALLNVREDAKGELTTIYAKYAAPETGNQLYGVLWLKEFTEFTLGLSRPDSKNHERLVGLVGASNGCRYAGLTEFIVVDPENPVPDEINDCIQMAYDTRREASA